MNTRPMIFRFCSGSVTPASRVEEALARVDRHERQVEHLPEDLLDLLPLAGAEQAVVDEDAA